MDLDAQGDDTGMFDEWESRCEDMVRRLLMEGEGEGPEPEGEDSAVELPSPPLLESMIQSCLQKAAQHKHRYFIRKDRLEEMLRKEFGWRYRSRWLKVILDTMQKKGYGFSMASNFFQWQPTRTGRWCHFMDKCKYIKDPEAYAMHFQQYIHLCPQGDRCKFVADCAQGRITRMAVEHFSNWKHKCPLGQECELYNRDDKEHMHIFTHRAHICNSK